MKRPIVLLMTICLAEPVHAAVTAYTDYSTWQSAAGSYSTIDFTEFAEGTHLTNQYASLGITFTDGLDIVYHSDVFWDDGAGLNGAFDSTSLSFNSPQYAIGVHFPGFVKFKLYNAGQLIYTSTDFNPPGPYGFAGLVSTTGFDSAIILDPTGGLFVDNLYFGPPVPAPGALVAMLGVAVLGPRRRRSA